MWTPAEVDRSRREPHRGEPTSQNAAQAGAVGAARLFLGTATAYTARCARSAVHLGQHSSRVRAASPLLAQLRDQEQKTSLPSLKGFFGVDQARASPNAKASAPAAEEEADEMSVGTMLREYGLIALAFHFTVWATCLATVYSALTFGVSPESLPEFLQPDADGGAAAAGALGRVAATLGVVEAIGPARLALTVAATPKVSRRARPTRRCARRRRWSARRSRACSRASADD